MDIQSQKNPKIGSTPDVDKMYQDAIIRDGGVSVVVTKKEFLDNIAATGYYNHYMWVKALKDLSDGDKLLMRDNGKKVRVQPLGELDEKP